ncbi:MAG TPA: serine/threonine-protein kinase, partial [Labilithrix sp.]|nr:serine/threonine-protein kinase [Labilithrix sp.]
MARYQIIDEKYRIVRLIGQGAWASVYEGVNVRINRRVAIKVLSKELFSTAGAVERFTQEAQAATRIDSKHVVGVFDLGAMDDGRPYIVMELLDGENLAVRLAQSGPLPPGRAIEIIVQVLRGLADSHAAGVMHRDIKPENVVLVPGRQGGETVKIVDFGISKLDVDTRGSLTRTQGTLGSPAYMSPEQCRGTASDHRSDLYSVGVVLFEALTGRIPHQAGSVSEMLFTIALEDAPDPRALCPSLDDDLAHIVVRALRREPADRFQTAQELEQALVGWAASRQVELDIGRSTLPQHATPSAFELPGVAHTRRQDLDLTEASRSRRGLAMTALGIGALGILTVALAVRLSGPRSVVAEVRTVQASQPSSPVLPAIAPPLSPSLAVPSV